MTLVRTDRVFAKSGEISQASKLTAALGKVRRISKLSLTHHLRCDLVNYRLRRLDRLEAGQCRGVERTFRAAVRASNRLQHSHVPKHI